MTTATHPLVALSPPPAETRHATPVMITPWYGGTHGGVAVAVEALVHALGDCGTSAPVIHLDWEGLRPRRSTGASGELISDLCIRDAASARAGLKRRAGFYVRKRVAAAELDRLMETHGVRVAHFHYAVFGMEVLMQLARQAGLGVVTTFHGSDVNVHLHDPQARDLVKEMIALSDRVVTVSGALAAELVQGVPSAASRTTVIYNAIPPNLARLARDTTIPSAQPAKWDGLLVGKVIYRKGGDVLLDAAARIVPEMPGLRLAFAGSGDDEGAFRDQARRLGIEDNVVFLGELGRTELLDAYRSSRVIVAPSRAEGLPLVLFESQWLGIPAVASRVGGIPELITDGENGFLVPPDDPDATASAWLRLLQDGALHRSMSARATTLSRERFAPSVMASTYQRLYDDVDGRASVVG